MDLTVEFDKTIRCGDKEMLFRWVMERLIWNPESIELRSMAAFAFMVNRMSYRAGRDMAESVLQEDPDQGWALASLMGTYSLDRIERSPWFFEGEVFKLGPEWNDRFWLMECKEEMRMLLYLQARFGPQCQKAMLSETQTIFKQDKGFLGGDSGMAGDPFCYAKH